MSKLRCIEVGDGYGDCFTLNKEYKCAPHDFMVFDNLDDGTYSSWWVYGEDDFSVLSLHDDPDSNLVARFEVVK